MAESSRTSLNRTLGLGALLAYGIGDILGAGIYAVVGKVASAAGAAGWISFLAAVAVAGFTALSYAELASRYPRAGSEPFYLSKAFGSTGLSSLVGWVVLCSAIISIATVSHAFAGYFRGSFPAVPEPLLIVGFLAALATLTFSGIRQTSAVNILCTVVEVGGLLLVLAVGWNASGGTEAVAASGSLSGGMIAAGAALAFYSFVGFEDLANVAEEARNPRRDLPIAILGSLAAALVLYVLVFRTAVGAIGPERLAASDAPLLEVVVVGAPSFPAGAFTAVAVFAVSNTALLNFVTSSRLLYGVARQGLAPEALGAVHSERRTPHWAIVVVFVAAGALALSGTLTNLAGAVSVLLLTVFFSVNASLLADRKNRTEEGFRAPAVTAAAGLIASPLLAVFAPTASLLYAAGVLGAGCGIAVLSHRVARAA